MGVLDSLEFVRFFSVLVLGAVNNDNVALFDIFDGSESIKFISS